MSGRWFCPNFHVESFYQIYSTKEPHPSQKWATWKPFSWVGDDFVQIFMSRVSWDLWYKRATSITEVSYVETIFMSGLWFRPNFNVESFLRSIIQASHNNYRIELSGIHFLSWRWFRPNFQLEIFLWSLKQESHINHRSELSGDNFHEWAMISSKFSCWEFHEIFNTREPHHSQRWVIWRPFPWVGDDFFQTF